MARVRVTVRVWRIEFFKETAIAVRAREVGIWRRRESNGAIALVAEISLGIDDTHAGARHLPSASSSSGGGYSNGGFWREREEDDDGGRMRMRKIGRAHV